MCFRIVGCEAPRTRLALGTLLLFSSAVAATASARRTDFAITERPSGGSEAKGDFRKLTEKLEKLRRENNVPGMSVVVVKDDKVVFIRGFGLRDVAGKQPVTANTVFAIGSASKAFTCLLTTQAAVENRLKLTDNPTKYLPNFIPSAKEQREKLTIADMMSHRSGFPRTDFAWWAGDFKGDELVQLLDQAKPTNKIGEKFLYQNLMLTLTGMIDSKVYGEPYIELVHDRIFQPLGMTRTSARSFFLKEQADHATGYEPAGAATADRPLDLHDADNVAPAGSIVSCATDMAQWLRLQLNNGNIDGRQLFSPEAIAEQRKPRSTVLEGMDYGFGWFLSKWGGTPQIDHGGNIDGFNSEVSMLPEKHIGVVVLTNVSAGPLADEAKSAVYQELVGPDALSPAIATKTSGQKSAVQREFKDAPDAVLGTYESKSPPLVLSFSKKGPKWIFTQGPITLDLKKVADSTYVFESPTAPKVRLSFVPNEKDKKQTYLLVEQGSYKFHLLKRPPYRAPITVAELISRVIEATGGVAAYEKQGHMTMHYHARIPADSVELYGIRYTRNATESADFAHAYALGRRFTKILAISTPTMTAQVVGHGRRYPSRLTPGGKATAEQDELALLHPKESYRSLQIVGEEKVDGDDAYILETVSRIGGASAKDWYSKKTYHLLKRESSTAGGVTALLSDYRVVDGVCMPFKVVDMAADGSPTIIEVDSVDFQSRIPDWPFKFPDSGLIE